MAHQHRTTCVSKRVAYCEVEHLLIGGRSSRFTFHIYTNSKGSTSVNKVSKLSLAEMKALLPPMPVLANEFGRNSSKSSSIKWRSR